MYDTIYVQKFGGRSSWNTAKEATRYSYSEKERNELWECAANWNL